MLLLRCMQSSVAAIICGMLGAAAVDAYAQTLADVVLLIYPEPVG